MSYISDAKRCPYCGGDMLVTVHETSGSRWHECGSCGTNEFWQWKGETLVHEKKHPTAFISLLTNCGVQEFKYYGTHPYKYIKQWMHNIATMPNIIADDSFGVVYNKKHKKFVTMFGQPVVYPDAYYEEPDETFEAFGIVI